MGEACRIEPRHELAVLGFCGDGWAVILHPLAWHWVLVALRSERCHAEPPGPRWGLSERLVDSSRGVLDELVQWCRVQAAHCPLRLCAAALWCTVQGARAVVCSQGLLWFRDLTLWLGVGECLCVCLCMLKRCKPFSPCWHQHVCCAQLRFVSAVAEWYTMCPAPAAAAAAAAAKTST